MKSSHVHAGANSQHIAQSKEGLSRFGACKLSLETVCNYFLHRTLNMSREGACMEIQLQVLQPKHFEAQAMEWAWPYAALAVFALSLLLWGGVVAIVLLTFF
jgi:hypothetical protein